MRLVAPTLPCASLLALSKLSAGGGETSGARDGLTLRPKVLETRGMLALARVQGRRPN